MLLKDWPPTTCNLFKNTIKAKPVVDGSVIAVHAQPHHADDVFCIACMKFLNPNITIIRTRDEDELVKADFRIDVGNKYDPTTGDFDHHQETFLERHKNPYPDKLKEGPRLAGFGLIWRHYSVDIIKAVLAKLTREGTFDWSADDDVINYIDEHIEAGLVSSVDALDNGEGRLFSLDTGYIRMPTIIKYIQNYNPCSWIEGYDHDRFFFKAVELAQNYLEREVIKLYGQVRSIAPILEGCKKAEDGYLVLEQYLPWGPVFTKFPEETKHIKFVIYPCTDGWMFQSPYLKVSVDRDRFLLFHPTTGEKRKQRYVTPSYLCGKQSEDIEKITGIKDTTFIHLGGFVGSCKTIESALELAKYIVEHQEW